MPNPPIPKEAREAILKSMPKVPGTVRVWRDGHVEYRQMTPAEYLRANRAK
jgi:hypothetical protein